MDMEKSIIFEPIFRLLDKSNTIKSNIFYFVYNINDNSRNSSDRFIPRRANANFDLSYYYIKKSGEKDALNPFFNKETDSFVNTAKYFYNLQQYRTQLWKTIMPDTKKILMFSSPKKSKDERSKYENPDVSLWPVHPRSKPLMGPPSIILDMPDLDTNIYHQVVDWGKKGYIGTIYEREVHLWHPEQKLKRHITNTGGRVQHCIKWNRDGTQFAMALNFSSVGIWDCDTCKMSSCFRCKCILIDCAITAIEWTTENYLITGCSEGRLCSWSPNFLCIKTFYLAHFSSIISIKASCNGNYLVTTGTDHTVRVWRWPDFSEDFEITIFRSPVKGIAWHPWKDSLMVLGGPKYTTLWNVNIRKLLELKYHPRPNSIVDCISFNPLSAELVMSYYCYSNMNGGGAHFLTVLKDLEKIVDEVQFHIGRVPYLLWDVQGTKLATASADENLCIWDFFGSSTATERKFLRATKKKEFSTDMFKNLGLFNSCIR